jgi:hypothetical protein
MEVSSKYRSLPKGSSTAFTLGGGVCSQRIQMQLSKVGNFDLSEGKAIELGVEYILQKCL